MSGSRDTFERALEIHRRGEFEQAAALYRAVLADYPHHFDANHLLGVVHLQRGELAQAERQIRRALEIRSDAAEPYLNLGATLRSQGRVDEALACYDRAIALKSAYPEAWCNRGNALKLLGRPAEALASHDRAIALKPDYADAYYNRGAALEDLQRLSEAVASYEKAISIRPVFPQAYNNLGNVLRDLRRAEDALAAYDRAIALWPDYADAFTNRGNALRDLLRFEESLASHDRAIALRPGFAEAWNNRGSTLRDMRRLDAAIPDFERALALKPDYAEAMWNTGLVELLKGDWERGWPRYEARFRKSRDPSWRPDGRAWNGEPLAGRRLLVYAEQGFGDAIQFVRFLRPLTERGAQVTLLVAPRLHRLLRTLSEHIELIGTYDPSTAFDFNVSLMSLPRLLGIRPDNIPASVPYLEPDRARVDLWRARLGTHGFKVGLCWQGNPAGQIDVGRSIPLSAFAPLARIAGVRLISLQAAHGLDQLEARPPGMTIEVPGHDFDGGSDAFFDTAAMMSNLDLVISSDTAIAHLAGALGRPVWIALKHVPDWRWLLERQDTSWYPTMRLFRQPRAGDWPAVVSDLASALAQAVASEPRGVSMHSVA